MGLCLWAPCGVPAGGSVRRSSSWASQSYGWALCHICCAERGCDGAVPSLPLCCPQVPAQPPFSLGRWPVGQARAGDTWQQLGWGALSSAAAESRESLGAAGSKPGTCSAASVRVLVWFSALGVPNEHWNMALSHCWVFQQTKENLIISSW